MQQQYSFDGENWEEYTSEITLTRNGTVYFRGIDAAGNISSVTTCTVDNIVEITEITEKPSFFVGDFSGNGKSMLAVKLKNTIVRYRNNGIIWSELPLDDGWDIAGVGDFNGNGTDDIAWNNTETGLAGYWQINDKQLTAWSNIAAIC